MEKYCSVIDLSQYCGLTRTGALLWCRCRRWDIFGSRGWERETSTTTLLALEIIVWYSANSNVSYVLVRSQEILEFKPGDARSSNRPGFRGFPVFVSKTATGSGIVNPTSTPTTTYAGTTGQLTHDTLKASYYSQFHDSNVQSRRRIGDSHGLVANDGAAPKDCWCRPLWWLGIFRLVIQNPFRSLHLPC